MQSIVQQRGEVPFASHIGERVYMREFRKADGLPFDLARWQPTVDAMLEGVDTDGPIYLMVDQGTVKAGIAHRRPGLHIDGYWIPSIEAHGGSNGGHRSAPTIDHGSHGGRRSGHVGSPVQERGGHGGGGEGGRHMAGAWQGATYEFHEGLLLASTVQACRAFAGEFDAAPSDGGDCAHIDTSGMQEVIMRPGTAYAGNVTMLHESLPVPFDCLRTVVRLNVPGWTPIP